MSYFVDSDQGAIFARGPSEASMELVIRSDTFGAKNITRRAVGAHKKVPFTMGPISGYAIITDGPSLEFQQGVEMKADITLVIETQEVTIADVVEAFMDVEIER